MVEVVVDDGWFVAVVGWLLWLLLLVGLVWLMAGLLLVLLL